MKRLLLTLLILAMAIPALAKVDSCRVGVAASGDDASRSGTSTYSLTGATINIGKFTTNYNQGWRFANITIAKGTTIDSAFILFKSATSRTLANIDRIKIYCEAADSAASFPVGYADYDTRMGDSSSRTIIRDTIITRSAQETFSTNNLKTPIQEVVNRVNWKSGNSLVIYAPYDSGGAEYLITYAYDSADAGDGVGDAVAPTLRIFWQSPDFTAGLVHKGPSTGQAAIRYQGTSMNYVHKKYHSDIKED